MNPNLIPAVDPAGLPGPAWLFHILLVFTFFLHMLFMNLTLGGTLLAAFAHLRSGGRRDDFRGALAGRLMAVNNFGISLTITTGVAPLLFIQVIYHQYFYTATILLASIWFATLILLTVGYYAAYLYKFRGAPTRGQGGGLWLGVSALMFFVIAMIHVAVNLVSSQPEKWGSLADGGWNVLGDPTFWPRLFHFVLAGIAFAALVAVWWAVRRAGAGVDVEINTEIARYAWRWALWSTVLQVADGFLLLMVLPKPVLKGLMSGGLATLGPLTLAIFIGIGLLMMLARASNPVENPGLVTGTLGAMTLTIAIMSITRHQVRALYLEPATSQHHFQVVSQWGNFLLFVVLLVAGLATVAYMVRRVLTSPATGEDAA
ncbi:MAG: hypothetical protein KAJ97_02210 [Acidobacteria bacterium]|nr:hypothetical protein [Acidobacteriota bacterium]